MQTAADCFHTAIFPRTYTHFEEDVRYLRVHGQQFTLANLCEHLFTSVGALKLGIDILLKEKVWL